MRTFILLAIVALAVASPIEDKKTPDISSLPLKKDEVKNTTAKVIDSYTQDGVHAHPLHKRDTQHFATSPVLTDPAAGKNAQQPSSAVKNAQQPSTAAPSTLNKSQVPLINNERQAASSNTQKPLTPTSNKATPAVVPASSATNQPKKPYLATDPFPPRPLSQSNIQPNLASSSRVRRDAPRPTDQKTSPVTAQQSSTQVKTSQVPTQQTKIPTAVPSPVQSSVKGSRVNRDTPKLVNTKSSSESAPVSAEKSSDSKDTKPIAPAGKAPAFPAKSSASDVKSPATVDSKSPASIASKSPVVDSTNVRKTREAPNPHEQSKIVPSATNAGTQPAHPSKDVSPLSPPALAKSPTTTPVHKRESPASNLRGDSQQLPSVSNNQSPQFVHPVPVDHILKKVPAPPAAPVTVTKTTETQITPALPTTETKTVEVTKTIVDVKH